MMLFHDSQDDYDRRSKDCCNREKTDRLFHRLPDPREWFIYEFEEGNQPLRTGVEYPAQGACLGLRFLRLIRLLNRPRGIRSAEWLINVADHAWGIARG